MACSQCGNPAADVYTSHGHTLHLCDRCATKFDLQTAFEQRLPDLIRLEKSGNWRAAIDAADSILAAYAARDHDGWLQRSVLAHKALIFEGAGELSEALGVLRRVASESLLDQSEFLVNQRAMARLLEKMGRPTEAIQAIEIGLDAAAGTGVPTALQVLEHYARLASSIGIAIPTTRIPLLQQTLEWWGIDIGVSPTNSSDLARAILIAADAERLAGARFRALAELLRNLAPGPDRLSKTRKLINEYLSQETVGYYRKRALQLLEGRSSTDVT